MSLRKKIIVKNKKSIDRSMYKAFVLPTLLYNCCTWGVTNSCMDRLDAFHRGLPPPHPHFSIVKLREPAPEMTSYVLTMQIRTVNLRAMVSARKSSGTVYFHTRGTPHNRSVCGKRSAHLISATRTRLNDGSLPKLFQTAAGQMIGIVMYIMLKIGMLQLLRIALLLEPVMILP